MARTAKKKPALTPEEKLEQALVPETEQPYQVPENWCWVKLGHSAEIIMGQSPEGSATTDDPTYMPLIGGAADMGELYPKASRYTKSPTKISSTSDIILCIRATLGQAIFSDGEYCLGRGVAAVRSENLFRDYLRYGFINFEQYLYDNATGTTFAQVSSSTLQKMPFPLPPLPEQHRIVTRIESLFAKLDEAREKAQAVVDGFEDRKAAILHKAFTGELTEGWRASKNITREIWRATTVKDVCNDVKVGIVIKPSQYYTDKANGTPAFRSANVREFHIDDFDWVYLNEFGMESNRRSVVHTGDVLVVRSGNPGTACVVEEKYDGYNAIDILIAVPDREIITSDFLCAFTNSPMGRNLVAENKRGMALAHFNVSGYSKLNLELPSVSEQNEIIRILFDLMDKELQAKEAAEQVIDQIDTMKKSILARAFRGELGTNDPEEESAVELVRRVL